MKQLTTLAMVVLTTALCYAQSGPAATNEVASGNHVLIAKVGSIDALPSAPMPQPVATTNNVLPATTAVIATATRREVSHREIMMWRGLTVATHAAAAFDAWSTRRSLSSGNGYERNPLMKPFANSAAIYPATQVAPLALDFVSRRMLRSENPVLRKLWWMPQTFSTAASIWVGVRNVHVANQ
jgi:hypothetical protein